MVKVTIDKDVQLKCCGIDCIENALDWECDSCKAIYTIRYEGQRVMP